MNDSDLDELSYDSSGRISTKSHLGNDVYLPSLCTPSLNNPITADNSNSSNSKHVDADHYTQLENTKRVIESSNIIHIASNSNYHPYRSQLSDTQHKQEAKPPKQRRHRKQPHELLTDEQKKANHIASEQKRRQNIRIGFDQLIDAVPSLSHGNRSESLILQKSVEHIRQLINVKNELKNQVRTLQESLGDINYEEDSSEDELAYVS
ncbi:MAG: hypothetical protein EXX96DRAFT_652728 [Benjaminiella poitrasii]|nr:MAG: hypothetical protein EXX96DRAFT_652728 [Benjaminiella poitrasii]